MALFNPSCKEILKQIQVNDLVRIRTNGDNPYYKQWNPPAEYRKTRLQEVFVVTSVIEDPYDLPIITLKLAD